MPTKKRRRPSSSASAGSHATGDDCPLQPLTLARCPPELQRLIIELACFSASGSQDALFKPDISTLLNISRVSRDFNAHAVPLLYQRIAITRPSSLYALQQVLQERPERAKLVKSLHIGPQGGPLPPHWWPTSHACHPDEVWQINSEAIGEPYEWLATSLPHQELPFGYESRQAWQISSVERPDRCREIAIQNAIFSAAYSLNVNLTAPGRGNDDSNIGSAWLSRVFGVQAALDLYLKALRRMEEKDDELCRLQEQGARLPIQCQSGPCEHYPTFIIADPSLRRCGVRLSKNTYVVSREDILRHLARPGSTTDRFDHPVVLSRSGFDVEVFRPVGYGHASYRFGQSIPARYEVRSEYLDVEDFHERYMALGLGMPHGDDEWHARWGNAEGLLAGPLSTATVGSTLKLTRSLLKSLTQVENLSLTGFVEQAITRGQGVSSSLSCLTLGPPPPCWSTPPQLEGLENLTELRVCGATLTKGAIERTTREMDQLRLFEWDMSEGFMLVDESDMR